MGYPATEGEEAVAAVLQALADPTSSSNNGGMEDAVYALALALRTLLVAYGEDEGVAMFEVCGPVVYIYIFVVLIACKNGWTPLSDLLRNTPNIYICIHTCTYVYIHIHIYTYIYICIHT